MAQVRLLDMNDFAPRFTSAVFHANVSESAAPDATILQRVRVSDADMGTNARYTLHVEPQYAHLFGESSLVLVNQYCTQYKLDYSYE